jgi:hypothetical protein
MLLAIDALPFELETLMTKNLESAAEDVTVDVASPNFARFSA